MHGANKNIIHRNINTRVKNKEKQLYLVWDSKKRMGDFKKKEQQQYGANGKIILCLKLIKFGKWNFRLKL